MSESGIPCASDRVAPFAARPLDRLFGLGVLTATANRRGEILGYAVKAPLRDLVLAVIVTGAWHHAIAAVLAEDRTGLVPVRNRPAEQAVEQAKMIAHEVRNALIPARHHVDALKTSVPEAQAGHLDNARRGIVRVLTFVEELVATSELIAEVATPFDLSGVVREALGWVEGGERIAVVSSAMAVRVRASRSQLARAVANVLRNAVQATEPGRAGRGIQISRGRPRDG